MDQLLLVAEQVGILFALMSVGFCCRKTNFLSREAIKGLVDFLVVIVTPAVIIDVFSRPFDATMLKGLGFAAILSIAIHLFAIVLSGCVFRSGSENTRVVHRLGVVFSNSGFMGIPMERAILGDVGVFFGVVYMAVFNLFMWSWGVRRMKKGDVSPFNSLRLMLFNPGTLGLALGLVVFLMPGKLPDLLGFPIAALSDCNTPLAMIVIGNYLAETRLGAALSDGRTLLAIVLRLVVVPVVFILGSLPFVAHGVNPTVVLALTVAASAPTAAMVSMFSAKFERDVATSVALVSASTLLSIGTMPLVISLAMRLFNR